jgi:hypothetical protein
MLKFTDVQTTMMMILPHLSPKEAATLHATCKQMLAHKGVTQTLSPMDYAKNWFDQNEKLHTFQPVECIGKLLAVHYPSTSLLNTKITANHFQWLMESDQRSVNSYIRELKITFPALRYVKKKATPQYEYGYLLFTGDFSSIPPPFVVESNHQ